MIRRSKMSFGVQPWVKRRSNPREMGIMMSGPETVLLVLSSLGTLGMQRSAFSATIIAARSFERSVSEIVLPIEQLMYSACV